MRFHAYGVGLAKTGTTTLSSAFALSGSCHEWANFRLNPLGRARMQGRLSDDEFWRLAGGRLTRPIVAMDVNTTHHLYADALADRFPVARFVWTTRGVREWSNSLLDMYVREDCRAESCGVRPLTWDMRYPGRHFTGTESITDTDDAVMLTSLIRAWSEHMHRMFMVTPPERTISVPVKDLSARLGEISAFVGGDPARLVQINRPANARPKGVTFDRWAHSSDWYAAYDVHAAELMRSNFPLEHEQIMDIRARQLPRAITESAWAEYSARTREVASFQDEESRVKHRRKLTRLLATSQASAQAVSALRMPVPQGA